MDYFLSGDHPQDFVHYWIASRRPRRRVRRPFLSTVISRALSYFEWKTDKPSPEVHGGTWCGSRLRSLKEEALTSEPAFTAALLETPSTQYRLSIQLFHIYGIFSLQHKMVASVRTILKSMLLSVQIPDCLEGADFLGIISISGISLVGSKQLFYVCGLAYFKATHLWRCGVHSLFAVLRATEWGSTTKNPDRLQSQLWIPFRFSAA